MYSKSFRVSFWLACFTALLALAFNLGYDALYVPVGYHFIGGPGLTSHLTTSYGWFYSAILSGMNIIINMICYLLVSAAEGLVSWIAWYWICRAVKNLGFLSTEPDPYSRPMAGLRTSNSPPAASASSPVPVASASSPAPAK